MADPNLLNSSSNGNGEGEHRAKRLKVEPVEHPYALLDQDSPVIIRESVIRPTPTLARENSSKSLSAVLKPPPVSAAAVPLVIVPEAVNEDAANGASLREKELARWSAASLETIPKPSPSILTDDAIIRRKLMFEAGNPPASSHRGIKLLTGSIGILVKGIKELRPEEDVETVARRVQLHLQQEDLALTRLTAASESVTKIAEKETNFPKELMASLANVEEQMIDQRKRLEEANKTETLFAGYVESANRIRKLESYDELLKTRNKLKEETKKLKEEKSKLDRQQTEKLPYLLIANWALKSLRYGEGSLRNISAARPGSQHHTKSTNKHRKSPKKSSKEPKG